MHYIYTRYFEGNRISKTTSQWVRIPDLGTSGTVVVSEILVQKGQVVEKGRP